MRGATAAFLAGAGVMAVEILASRWLAPVFGFTLATWAWLISVTLLAGAVGAALGGRPSRRIPDRTLLGFAFVLAGLWVGLDALLGPWCMDRYHSTVLWVRRRQAIFHRMYRTRWNGDSTVLFGLRPSRSLIRSKSKTSVDSSNPTGSLRQ